ncbi:indole-3-glycerol-phosphate synthase [Nonomuraea sp. B12E4]|uniref:indole-3-glycerol-phosphate synthase n=1 Tax=Nonomuraea sp. B12E4 TaxID=3153564 RepID=UPI00325E6D44
MSFIDTLLAAERPLIMEVKRRDADGGDLLGGRPVGDVVAAYEAAGAPCLSVVTGRWFGGDLDLLREVADLTGRPLLQKDFVTRHDQVPRAARLGASAVLLTAALLPRSSLRSLVAVCLEEGLTPFVEVTTEEEIAAVPDADRCVIAVNNKDIKVRERDQGDVERSLKLLPALARSGTRCPVSASGIDGPPVAARLLDHGYAGLLVATALLRATSPRAWSDDVHALRTTS